MDGPAFEAAILEFDASGRTVHHGFDVPDHPWTLDCSQAYVASGDVEVASAMELLIRGASVVVCVPDTDQAARIWDEGRRVSTAEWYDAHQRPTADGLDGVQVALLLAISEGMDVETAGRSVNLSSRTAARRIATARSTLGVATTAAAAARVRSRIRALRIGPCA